MYVKLVNPLNKRQLVFKCPIPEVYYIPAGEFDEQAVDTWTATQEERGQEARHFVVWLGKRVHLTEITIPGRHPGEGRVLLTNWDAYLCNDRGHTVDKIHRHLQPLGPVKET